MKIALQSLDASDTNFDEQLEAYVENADPIDPAVEKAVREIIADVRARGDSALLEYTARFDQLQVNDVSELRLSKEQISQQAKQTTSQLSTALEKAATRIQRYAEKQLTQDWSFEDEIGVHLGQKLTAIDAVGLYVPGGKAAYPSSVLMNVIPAKVAGVGRIVAAVPTPQGEMNTVLMRALELTEVDEVYTIGGAQAIAALAYGSQTITPVSKIIGPGNAYVSEAKRQVFGKVGIDMVAGPSEILVITDGATNPEWIALDLFSQAEHDNTARAILICPNKEYLQSVLDQMNQLIDSMPRADIICRSLKNNGLFIAVKDISEAVDIANRIAPEHLELSVEQPQQWLKQIRHVGAVFIGPYTSEVLGDYCAGSNHVLPTGGSARFFSPLGVYDFQKRTSWVKCSAQAAEELSEIAQQLAEAEGLFAHAAAARSRATPLKS